MRLPRKIFPVILIVFFPLTGAGAQDLYWDNPVLLETRGVRFPQAASGGGLAAVAWQEFTDGGIYLSLRTSRDMENWNTAVRFAGPFMNQEITAVKAFETPIFSMTVDENGSIYFAVAAAADQLTFFSTEDEGETFSKSILKASTTMISPKLFIRGNDRGIVLFVVQRSTEVEAQNIYYAFLEPSDFNKSSLRPKMTALVEEKRLVSNFLPHYTVFKGREYVAYQSQDGSRAYPNQIFLKISDEKGNFRTNDEPIPITYYQVEREGQTVPFPQFENLRPFLFAMEDRLALAWERSFPGEPNQIYYVELNENGEFFEKPSTDSFGNPFGPFQPVSDGRYTCFFPQIFRYRGVTYMAWFDNRRGDNHIIVAEKDQTRWKDSDISRKLSGSSIFPWVVKTGDLFNLYWENQYKGQSRLFSVSLDQHVDSPRLVAGNFTAGRPSQSSEVSFRWSQPDDPSGISGYSFAWTREEKPALDQKLKLGAKDTSATEVTDEDGAWYFHIAAQDFAGNWSAPSTIRYMRDTVPPSRVSFTALEEDEKGYLVSNDLTIKWTPTGEDSISGYNFRLDKLSSDSEAEPGEEIDPDVLSRRVLTQQTQHSYGNLDNGLWAFSAAALDVAGNMGEAERVLFRLNKYKPATLIYQVTADTDDLGSVGLSIFGKGFSTEGYIKSVILDRDGKEPFDYIFFRSKEDYKVSGDRYIVGPRLDLFEEGIYRVGLNHSGRGLTFYSRRLALSPSGTVKLGDYSSSYVPPWESREKPLFLLPINNLYLGVIILFLCLVFAASVGKLVSVAREGRFLQKEVVALLTGPISPERKEEKMKELKRRGLGLRFKFATLVTVLVILIVLPVSVYFGFSLIRNQTDNLANGLREKAALMLGSMSAGSVENLLDNDPLPLRNVADQMISMGEALYATITAVVPFDGETIPAEPGGLEYVWATNDPDLTTRESFVSGKFQMPRDDVSTVLKDVTIRINEKAAEEVGSLVEQIEANIKESIELHSVTDDKSAARLNELSTENKTLENQVRNALQTIANQEFNSIPEFDLQNLKEEYIFYMPITYRKAKELFYYRGMVRLGVSAENIIHVIRETRKNLFINSAIFALGAIGLGILGALVLASITVNPIKKLVSGVATIRDTADKEELKSHVIRIKQKDELRILADTVNEMTRGLVAAAVAAKDLTLGKEIQKMFIPLEKDARGQKMTTGGEKTDKVEIFGYYEGAKGVSGDYFEYKKLDAQHYAVIKCDVAGKGVPAALIMVEVATIFLTYFRNWNIKSPGLKIDSLAYMINDMLEERGFQGRFAALIIGIINVETGAGYLCNAGDNIVNIYDSVQKKMIRKILPETPAAGVFPSMLLEMKSGFVTVPIKLNKGDTLLLYTDGVFEAQRLLRDENYKILSWQDIADKGWDLSTDKGTEAAAFEELSEERLDQVQNAVFTRKVYKLVKYQNPNPEEELTFDFSGCAGSVEDAVLAMVSVEKIFRIYTDPAAAPEDTVRVDRRIDAFLDKHFVQHSLYFTNRIDRDEESPYVSFGNLKEDSQYDDLTILGIKLL